MTADGAGPSAPDADSGALGPSRFTRAFVAATGSAARARVDPPDHLDPIGPAMRYVAGNTLMARYGESAATLSLIDMPGTLAFTGRPHPISGDGRPPVRAWEDPVALAHWLSGLDGRFAVLGVSRRGLFAATDMIGAGSLFVYESGDVVCVASHLGLLLRSLGVDQVLDDFGCVATMSLATSIDGSTPFAGIRRLRSGELIRAGAAQSGSLVAGSRYIDLASVLAADEAMNDADALDEALLACALREAPLDRAAMMLSAGHDSRAVLEAFARAGRPLSDSVTYGSPNSVDLRLGSSLARDLGLSATEIPVEVMDYMESAGEIIGLHGGLVGLHSAMTIDAYKTVGRCYDTAVVGYLGDCMSGGHLPLAGGISFESSLRQVVPKLDSHGEEVSSISRAASADVRSALKRRWDALEGLRPHQRAMILDLEFRQATLISTAFDLAACHVDIATPFFDRRLLRLFFNLPEESLRGQRTYRHWVSGGNTGHVSSIRRRAFHLAGRSPIVKPLVQRLSRSGRLPPETMDYRGSLRRSRASMAAAMDGLPASGALHSLCRDSIDRLDDASWGAHPFAVFALPILMAHQGTS